MVEMATKLIAEKVIVRVRQISHLPAATELQCAIEGVPGTLWHEVCREPAGALVDRLRGTDDAIRVVLKSIRSATSENPPKDWQAALADAAACLEGIRCI